MKIKELALSSIALATVSFIGVNIASAQTTNSQTTLMSPVPSSQHMNNQDTRLRLRMLMQEHTVLAGETLIARFDNRPDFETARLMLNKNGDVIASIIENLYGADTRREFLTTWQEHNDLYIRYTDALKSGNRDAQRSIKADLDRGIVSMGNLFSTRLQGANRDQVTNLFRDHVYFTRLVIENHAAKDYTNEYMNKHTGYEHAAAMADVLSGIPWNY